MFDLCCARFCCNFLALLLFPNCPYAKYSSNSAALLLQFCGTSLASLLRLLLRQFRFCSPPLPNSAHAVTHSYTQTMPQALFHRFGTPAEICQGFTTLEYLLWPLAFWLLWPFFFRPVQSLYLPFQKAKALKLRKSEPMLKEFWAAIDCLTNADQENARLPKKHLRTTTVAFKVSNMKPQCPRPRGTPSSASQLLARLSPVPPQPFARPGRANISPLRCSLPAFFGSQLSQQPPDQDTCFSPISRLWEDCRATTPLRHRLWTVGDQCRRTLVT